MHGSAFAKASADRSAKRHGNRKILDILRRKPRTAADPPAQTLDIDGRSSGHCLDKVWTFAGQSLDTIWTASGHVFRFAPFVIPPRPRRKKPMGICWLSLAFIGFCRLSRVAPKCGRHLSSGSAT